MEMPYLDPNAVILAFRSEDPTYFKSYWSSWPKASVTHRRAKRYYARFRRGKDIDWDISEYIALRDMYRLRDNTIQAANQVMTLTQSKGPQEHIDHLAELTDAHEAVIDEILMYDMDVAALADYYANVAYLPRNIEAMDKWRADIFKKMAAAKWSEPKFSKEWNES